jgi:hypothetical protein
MFTGTDSDRVKRVARVTLAMALLAALLACIFPLEAVATGQTCALACCAGRAPHAAGSCMNGSCHAVLSKTSAHSHSPQRKQVVAQLCGAARLLQRLESSKSSKTVSGPPAKNESTERQLSSNTIHTPCQPDCGSCASGLAGSDSKRNVALSAHAQPPSPLFDVRQLAARSALSQTLHALCRQCAPRAPPVSFS